MKIYTETSLIKSTTRGGRDPCNFTLFIKNVITDLNNRTVAGLHSQGASGGVRGDSESRGSP